MSLRSLSVLARGSSALTNVNSVLLDGSNEYIDCGNVTPTTDMSVFAWARWNSAAVNLVIVGKWEASDSERSFLISASDTDSSKMLVLLSGSGSAAQKTYRGSVTCLQTSAWHFVGFTFVGGTDTLKCFVDGVEDTGLTKVSDTALTGGAIFNSAAKCMIGALSKNAGGAIASYWNGYIDQVTMWNKALSGAEITELYGAGEPPDARVHSAAANLIHYWPLGEGSDTNTLFEDYAGSNDGTGVNIESGDIQTDIP